MSEKKKKRTIIKSDNLYLLMRARNIIMNEEKLKEPEVKEKEAKFTKDSLGKIQASSGQIMQIK